MARALFFSGFDLHPLELKEGDQLYQASLPLPPVDDFPKAVADALEAPVDGEPLSRRLKEGARVTVVLDDFSMPVPPAAQDCRRTLLGVVLAALARAGVAPDNIQAVVASGLSRKWRPEELEEWLGQEGVAGLNIRCHDAEAQAELVRLAERPEGPIEVSRFLLEADLVIHLNVVNTPIQAGWFPLVSGMTGYRTARALHAPELFGPGEVPLAPGSAYHRAHEPVAAMLREKVPVLQIGAVLNNDVFSPAFQTLVGGQRVPSRRLRMWNALPEAVRHRAARLFRAPFSPLAVVAGSPDAVATRVRHTFLTQHERRLGEEAEVIMFGLPDLGPASVGASQNPVLAASLALGYIMNLATGRPLLKDDGVVVFANPLTPSFAKVHQPHHEFYEKVLRQERNSVAIRDKFEAYFEGKPEFINNYQRRYAFHGSHPLFAWSLTSPVRDRARAVIVAYGDPRACARMGFTPANDLDDARKKAADVLGKRKPKFTVLGLPPPFWLRLD